jgi:membrane peptidoglycan carboxypeptidase
MAEKGKTEQQNDTGRKKKKKKQNKVLRKIKLFFQVMFLLLMIAVLIAVLVLYFKYGKSIMALQDEANAIVAQSTEESFRQSETTLVYYDDGSRMAKLKGEKDTYYLDYEEIPEMAVKAMVAIEDKKFFKHNGIDLTASIRAAVALVKNRRITQGGSTITMQLARNVFISKEQSMERKIKEMYIAVALEKKYSKTQIMEFYLNNIYFMNGYYGIQAAAKGYFGKSVNELDLSQIAFLCAIPNSPTYYDPLEHKDHTLERRDRILTQMKEEGYISEAECAAAQAEEITVKEPKTSGKRKSYESYVYECAIKALMKAYGFTFENEFDSDEDEEAYDKDYEDVYNQCKQKLYNNGYRVYTSISKKKQKKLQKQVNTQLSRYKDKTDGIYNFQGAAVCIDNKDGRVVAIVGGRSQKVLTGYELNRAYQSFRQPGSSIKPLIVYTPLFESNLKDGDGNYYTPSSIVTDQQISGGPKNSSGTYSGNITVRYALEQSKNTVAWQLFEKLTPLVGLQYLLDMNFKKIVDDDYGLASSLGGLTYGASPVEMTAAYAALENDGVYREPTCIVRITDSDGNEIVSEDDVEEKRVYKKDAARMVTDIMQGVLTKGTAKGHSLSATASAGKTGTTNDKKDGWFMGYTRYYTTGVWVGCDMPKAMSDLSGATYPLSIWYNFMQEIHQNKEWKDFKPYEDKEDDSSSEDDYGYDEEDDIYDDGDYEEVTEDEPEEPEDENVEDEPEASFEPVEEEPEDKNVEDEPEDDEEDEYEETPEVVVNGDEFGNDGYDAGLVDDEESSQGLEDEPEVGLVH